MKLLNWAKRRLSTEPILRKIIKEDTKKLAVFGTGNPTRAFLYVEDFCDGALLAIEKGIGKEPINIGSDEEISIKNVVKKICDHAQKNPTLIFDISKPDGQPRRASDITFAEETLGFKPMISLDEGLRKTIQWYKKNM